MDSGLPCIYPYLQELRFQTKLHKLGMQSQNIPFPVYNHLLLDNHEFLTIPRWRKMAPRSNQQKHQIVRDHREVKLKGSVRKAFSRPLLLPGYLPKWIPSSKWCSRRNWGWWITAECLHLQMRCNDDIDRCSTLYLSYLSNSKNSFLLYLRTFRSFQFAHPSLRVSEN